MRILERIRAYYMTPKEEKQPEKTVPVTGIVNEDAQALRTLFGETSDLELKSVTLEIKDGAVVVAGKDGNTFEIPADNVILSVGYKPAPLATKGKHIHVIGDADKVGNLRSVIWGAWDVCMKL